VSSRVAETIREPDRPPTVYSGKRKIESKFIR
jgi:hypothetical protein